MAHSPETISAVRAAYVYEALNREQLSERFNVPVSTVTRWKKGALENGDDWDRARTAARISGQGVEAVITAVLEDYMLMFQSTLDDVKKTGDIKPLERAEVISRLSDAFAKTVSAAAKGSPKLNKLAVAMEVLQLLVKYIQVERPDLVEPFSDVLTGFGEKLAGELR
ncbi:MAG: DUF1804 family protein [Nitrosomonas sp.]|nr:DUF1804 family protein [Nitrosomonas sp.]